MIVRLDEYLDVPTLFAEIREGYIRRGKHPRLPLDVYCYTEKAVYEARWTDTTRKCRGLVVGPQDSIVGWCMPKFFNASEHIEGRAYTDPLPDEPFQIFTKIDGSLGTVFNYEGQWLVATKGGFSSEQAAWAQDWLYNRDLSELNPANTYITEIVYPENRIVVQNGKLKSLVLLAVFGDDGKEKTLTGHGGAWERLGGYVTREWPAAKLSRLLFYAQRNQRMDGTPVSGTQSEGYVLKYRSGIRAKVKFSDYIRLHGVVTGLTERQVWEVLRDGKSLDSLFEVLPDEYHDWLEITASMLRSQFRDYGQRLAGVLLESGVPADPRKFREFADDGQMPPGLFALYDVLAQQTWAQIKPAAVGPWKDHE